MAQDEAAMVATAQDDGQRMARRMMARRMMWPRGVWLEGRGAGLEERSLYRKRRCQAGGDKSGARGEEVRRQGEDKGSA